MRSAGDVSILTQVKNDRTGQSFDGQVRRCFIANERALCAVPLLVIAGGRVVRGIIVANLVANVVFYLSIHQVKSTTPFLVALVTIIIILGVIQIELVNF